MRISSSLIAFIFLGVAAAGVVPDLAGRKADGNSSKGGHSASVSGAHSHPSGSPTGSMAHTIPSSIPSGSPPARREANPSFVHSVHAYSRRAEPTDSASHPAGSPSGASESAHPTKSAGSHSRAPASRRAQPTDGQSRSPSGASDHPAPSGTPTGSAHPNGGGAHKSGSPSDISIQPKPTASQA